MKKGLGDLTTPLLRLLDAERAHALALRALRAGYPAFRPPPPPPRLATSLGGLPLRNPIGCAAGFDKNGEVVPALSRLGFGFVEIGTVTPKPQAGNPRPRVFRFPAQGSIVNRLGSNSRGAQHVVEQLQSLAVPTTRPRATPLGINVGANANSTDPIADSIEGLNTFYAFADYLVINISSPNTPGLRNLQHGMHLCRLFDRVRIAMDRLADHYGFAVPLYLKLAPDLDDDAIHTIAEALGPSPICGLILTNTTANRTGLRAHLRRCQGGLSGKLLFNLSTAVLARFARLLGPAHPLIGVGGVHGGESALEKFRAGASAIQLYTGAVFAGPGLIRQIGKDMDAVLKSRSLQSIDAVRGEGIDEWNDRYAELVRNPFRAGLSL